MMLLPFLGDVGSYTREGCMVPNFPALIWLFHIDRQRKPWRQRPRSNAASI